PTPARADHVEPGRGLTERRDAVEADLALLGEPGHRREDHVAHILGGEALARPLGGDVVVELEQVDAVSAQSLQTLLEAASDSSGERRDRDVGDANLGAD